MKSKSKQKPSFYLGLITGILFTCVICLPFYLIPTMKLPYRYTQSNQLLVQHDNITTENCILYRDCDKAGSCQQAHSTCSYVHVWLANLENNGTICNYQTLDEEDGISQLQYDLSYQYVQGTIVTGYIHHNLPNSCESNLTTPTVNLILLVVFGTILPFILFSLGSIIWCERRLNKQSIILISPTHIVDNIDL